MKLIFVILFFNFCNCEVQLPSGILNAKDAIEAEGNKKALDNLKNNFGNESSNGWIGHVTGGSLATLGQFPYQALIYMTEDNTNWFTCGGSLITYRTILTAAHCIEPFITFNIYLGIIDRTKNATFSEENLSPNYSHYHEEYHSEYLWNDIGLLYLPSAIQSILNHPCNCIGIVNLPEKNDETANLIGAYGTLSGFGKASDSDVTSQYLRYANILIVSNEQCVNTFGNFFINETTMCASGSNGISSCGDDSGGPWVAFITPFRRVQVALVSFGSPMGCQLGHPTVHTKVTSYLDWIEEHKNLTVAPETTQRITTLSFTQPSESTTIRIEDTTTVSNETSTVTLPDTTSFEQTETSTFTTSIAETTTQTITETTNAISTSTSEFTTSISESTSSTSEPTSSTNESTTSTSSTLSTTTESLSETTSNFTQEPGETTETSTSTNGMTSTTITEELSTTTSANLSTTLSTLDTTTTILDTTTITSDTTTTDAQTTTSQNVPLSAPKSVKFNLLLGILIMIIRCLL